MSYGAIMNACNASTWAEQNVNKPNYTAGNALKRAFFLLKIMFKSRTVSMVDNNNNTRQ